MTDRLRALALAATPGPWEPYFSQHGDPFVVQHERGPFGTVAQIDVAPNDYGRKNAEFIAAANPAAILALLDRLSAAEQLAEVWKEKAHTWIEQQEKITAGWTHACHEAEKERDEAYERAAQAVLSLNGSFNDLQRSALAAVIRALRTKE